MLLWLAGGHREREIGALVVEGGVGGGKECPGPWGGKGGGEAGGLQEGSEAGEAAVGGQRAQEVGGRGGGGTGGVQGCCCRAVGRVRGGGEEEGRGGGLWEKEAEAEEDVAGCDHV